MLKYQRNFSSNKVYKGIFKTYILTVTIIVQLPMYQMGRHYHAFQKMHHLGNLFLTSKWEQIYQNKINIDWLNTIVIEVQG